jgi:hypothetical protein
MHFKIILCIVPRTCETWNPAWGLYLVSQWMDSVLGPTFATKPWNPAFRPNLRTLGIKPWDLILGPNQNRYPKVGPSFGTHHLDLTL